MLLFGPIEVTLFVNEPGDLLIGTEFGAKLIGAKARGVDKVRPPMIVGIGFVLLPLMERRPADKNDPFRVGPASERAAGCKQEQNRDQNKSGNPLHRPKPGALFSRKRKSS